MTDTSVDTSISARLRRRRPWLAALLSFLVMGLGSLYNARLRVAILWFAAELLGMIILFAALAAGVAYTFEGLLVLLTLGGIWTLGGRAFAMTKAYTEARRAGVVALRPWNRWYLYAAVILLAALWPELPRQFITSWHIPSGAMQPNLQIGDHLEAQAGAYRHRLPERGEIVVFKLPTDPGVSSIMRVVGLPGDTVQIRGGKLYINGAPALRELVADYEWVGWSGATYKGLLYRETLPEGSSHLILEEGDDSLFDDTQVFSVPADHVFVLGDNRDNALDSRATSTVGPVPLPMLTDKPLYIYWSSDLRRIGLPVR